LAQAAGNQTDNSASEKYDGNLQKELDRKVKVVHTKSRKPCGEWQFPKETTRKEQTPAG